MNHGAFLLILAVALASARVLAHVFDRMKLPPILGQILAGLLLARLPGPVPDLLRGEVFTVLSEFGLLTLLLVTGTESRLADIRRAGFPATLVAIGGVVVPFALGFGAARYLGMGLPASLATGALFTPTSIGITAVTLLEAHRLRTTVGATLVGAAILDDVIALGLMAIVLGTGSLGAVLGKSAAYFAGAALFGWLLLPRLYQASRTIHVPETPLSFVLVACFGLAGAAELLGLAAITGAFLAGLAVRETMGEEKLLGKVHALAHSFFVPLFFLHLGADLQLEHVGELGRYAPVLLAASLVGKFLGSALGGLAGRLGWARSIQVGVGMLPRMEVSLVVVALAARQGIFAGRLAGIMTGIAVLNMVASLLTTPVLLRLAFRMEPEVEHHHPPM